MKKTTAIVVVVILIVLGALFFIGRDGDRGVSRALDVTEDFLEKWQQTSGAQLSERIQAVAPLVSQDFVSSLSARIEASGDVAVDPITCFPKDSIHFRMMRFDNAGDTVVVSARDMSSDVGDFVEVILIPSGETWRVNDVRCISEIEDSPIEG